MYTPAATASHHHSRLLLHTQRLDLALIAYRCFFCVCVCVVGRRNFDETVRARRAGMKSTQSTPGVVEGHAHVNNSFRNRIVRTRALQHHTAHRTAHCRTIRHHTTPHCTIAHHTSKGFLVTTTKAFSSQHGCASIYCPTASFLVAWPLIPTTHALIRIPYTVPCRTVFLS